MEGRDKKTRRSGRKGRRREAGGGNKSRGRGDEMEREIEEKDNNALLEADGDVNK